MSRGYPVTFMQILKYDHKKHFKWVEGFFNSHGMHTKSSRFPRLGVIAENVAAVFIYHDQSSQIAFLHNFISNKKASRRLVVKAVKSMEPQIKKMCEENGIKTVLAFTRFNSLAKSLEQISFLKSDHGLTEMIRELP